MASQLEKIMDEFEASLSVVLSASHGDRRAFSQRLADARVNADHALASRSGADNEFRAADERAFGTARQNFR